MSYRHSAHRDTTQDIYEDLVERLMNPDRQAAPVRADVRRTVKAGLDRFMPGAAPTAVG